MKQLILFILFTTSTFLGHSQVKNTYDYKLIYNYEFQIDSADIYSSKQEDMILLFNKDKSYFYSSSKYSLDTLKSNNKNKSIQELLVLRQSVPKQRIKFDVEKNFKNQKIKYFEKIFLTTYKSEEDYKKLDWSIENETKKIGEFICSKALTTFAGRNYIAWFTNEIPISNGPYKFDGLPGMIIEINDSKNQHHFTLKEFKEETGKFPVNNKKIVNATMPEIKKARDNQIQNVKQSGFNLNPELMKKVKEKLNKRNNPIELDNN
jgi:GLPGLI family protein